ncbi:MAG: ABC transporter substrate-binding protein [Lautropia sp.]
MNSSRFLRSWTCRFLLACAAALLVPVASFAQQPLKKVRLAIGTPIINVGYPSLTLPVALGYWRDEGYDVELVAANASLQALQQMIGGNVEFASINSSAIIQANTMNNVPVRVVTNNGVVDWTISVLEDSPVKSVKDLKGKTVGVVSLATGGVLYYKSFLRANGLDPDKDVNLVTIGMGVAPVEAMKSGKVQGLLYWAAAQAAFENAGLKLRHLRDPAWTTHPDISLATTQRFIDSDPRMVEAIARGVVKGTLFAFTNPDCARRVHWARWPQTKPSGSSDEATLVKWDMNNLTAQLDSMKAAHEMNGGKLFGRATAEPYARNQDFLFDNKLIDKKIPAQQYLINIPGFFEKINDFDHEAVRRQAQNCPVK